MLIKIFKLKLAVILMTASLYPSNSFCENNDNSFNISQLKDMLEKAISEKLERGKISIKNASINRKGSKKFFHISEISKLKLDSDFQLDSIDINETNSSFKSTIKPTKNNVDIMVKGNFIDSIKVPVAITNLRKGTEIDQDDLEFKYFAKNKVKGSSILDITKLIGQVAKKDIKKDSIISFKDVNKPTLIKRNKFVKAYFKMKNMEVKTIAIALQDGKEGDVIRLKNSNSGKIFQGMVDKEGKILVGVAANDNMLSFNNL